MPTSSQLTARSAVRTPAKVKYSFLFFNMFFFGRGKTRAKEYYCMQFFDDKVGELKEGGSAECNAR